MRKLCLLLLVALVAACSSDTGGGENVCEPGASQDCTCPDDSTGQQDCNADGTAWGDCQCGCEKDCTGRQCGEDPVCGESCGGCGANQTCDQDGQCACDFESCADACCAEGETCHQDACCAPDCTGKACGDDACGGSCGDCGADGTCDAAGQCLCTFQACQDTCCAEGEICHQDACCLASCEGRVCGDDGCGSSCGDCGTNQDCDVDGQCVCAYETCQDVCCAPSEACFQDACCLPDCFGRECGDDACGGSCGDCQGDAVCDPDGQCVTTGCPNGVLEVGEECDTDDFGTQTCQSAASQPDGYLLCNQDCTIDTSMCSECGDGTIGGAEQCEQGDLAGQTCQTVVQLDGDLACGPDCQFDVSNCHGCGNGVIEGQEVCDGSNLNDQTCLTQASHQDGELACSEDCMSFDTSDCHTCGNGTLEVNEECDTDDFGSNTCDSLGYDADTLGYEPGPLLCSSTCNLNICGCITCCDHGACAYQGGNPTCQCSPGYHLEDLRCALDYPPVWPPDIETLWDPITDPDNPVCLVPECDECGTHSETFDPSGTWTQTLNNTSSTCTNSTINSVYPITQEGETEVNEGEDLGTCVGTCIYDSDDVHTTTMIDSILASCTINEYMGVVTAIELGIVSFSGDTGTGNAHVYLYAPDLLGGDCDFYLDVTYQREP